MAATKYVIPFKIGIKAISCLSRLAIGIVIIASTVNSPADGQEPQQDSLQPLFEELPGGDSDQLDGPNALVSFEDDQTELVPTATDGIVVPFNRNSTELVQAPSRWVEASTNLAATMQLNQPTPQLPLISDNEIGPVYQLSHTNWQSFEQKLLKLWNQRLAISTSTDGRYVRLLLPTKNSTSHLPILIDRTSNTLSFEGTEGQTDSWSRLVRNLDRPLNDGRVSLIDMQDTEQSLIMQTAYMMGFQEEQSPGIPSQEDPQENPQKFNQGDNQRGNNIVTGVVPLNPNQINQRQRPTIFKQEDELGVLGPVKIEVVPELGIIILTGNELDVAKVEKMINDIIEKTSVSEATQRQILLENAQSSQVAERLQELYDNNYADAKGQASISAWDTPNSLIVIGQADSIRVIEDLVRLVDVKTPGKVKPEFKTYRLRYISAVDAKNRVNLLLGQSATQATTDTQPPPLPAIAVADFRTNTLMVRASQVLLEQIDLLIKDLDVESDSGGAVNLVKIIPVYNAIASDLAIVIQDAINGQLPGAGFGSNPDATGQQNQQNQQNQQQSDTESIRSQLRATMLEFVTEGENGERLRSSYMFDVRVSSDANSNSLVVTGPEAAMPLIEALAKRLDRIPDAETQIKIFKIHNGDAASLLEMLDTLFNGAAQGGQAQNTGANALPLQSSTAGDGATLANLRFSVDERTNRIIASGPASDLMVIDSLITLLDEENSNGRETHVYRLSNLQAQDMADAIDEWLDERQTFIEDDPNFVSPIAQIRRLVSVTPVAVGNSLIVSAVPEYYDEIIGIIEALDRRPPMVKVKVLLAEVDLSVEQEFGVQVGVQDSLLFDRGVAGLADGLNEAINFNFNQAGIGNGNVARKSFVGQAISNLGVGRTNSSLGYGGLVISAGNDSVNVLLRALEDKKCLRILSKPHMMTIENLQGRIFSGRSVPRITGTSQNNLNGGISNSVEDEEVGLILGITPRVSPDGTIVMFVDLQQSKLDDEDSGIAIAVSSTGEVIRSPQIIRRQIQTTIQARHGQTVVISGLVQEDKAHFQNGTPILSDLPVIGPLFKYEGDRAVRSELLVILTPYLVNHDEEIEMQNQDEMDRMHWCESDIAEIYGNTEYNGRQMHSGSTPTVYYPDMDPTGSNPQLSEPQVTEPIQPQRETVPNQPIYELEK